MLGSKSAEYCGFENNHAADKGYNRNVRLFDKEKSAKVAKLFQDAAEQRQIILK